MQRHKKKVIIGILGFIAFLAVVMSLILIFTFKPEKISLSNQYTEKHHRFSIHYPSGWTYTEPRDVTVIFKGEKGTPEYKSTILVGFITFKNRNGAKKKVKLIH